MLFNCSAADGVAEDCNGTGAVDGAATGWGVTGAGVCVG